MKSQAAMAFLLLLSAALQAAMAFLLLRSLPLLLSAALLNAQDPRTWQTGTVLSISAKHRPFGAYPLVTMEVSTPATLYTFELAYKVRMKDLIPVTGDIHLWKSRQADENIDLIVGQTIRFAISAQHVWVIDNNGNERKMIFRTSLARPDK